MKSKTKQTSIKQYSAWMFESDFAQEWAYWDNVFTPEECQKIIEIGNSRPISNGTVSGGAYAPDITDKKVRSCDVSWLYADTDTTWIFERLSSIVNSLNRRYFQFDITGFCEGLQFTKYKGPNDYFDSHVDRRRGHIARKLSISIQLSDPKSYKGGEFDLYLGPTPTEISRDQGYACVFPSYSLHGIRPVTEGTRYSLVGWVTGPNFK